jgi:hypothetical protein
MVDQGNEKNIDITTVNGATELETQVQCRLTGQIREFRLMVVDKGLILRGHAHTYYAKQLAQHAVMEATGLPIVANEIEVS